MNSLGYDHLGLLYHTLAEVETPLDKTRAWGLRDHRGPINEYEVFIDGQATTPAFYVWHRLPIGFDDPPCQEVAAEQAASRHWTLG